MACHSILGRNFAWIAIAAALVACAHQAPPLPLSDVPGAWSAPQASAPSATPYWWGGFKSAELSELLAEAEASGIDLKIAALRVIEAKAQAQAAGADLWPGINLGASAGRRGEFTPGARTSSLNATLGLSYEADLLGRVRAGNRAALASLDASRYDRDAVALTLASGVANAYLGVLAQRDRLRVARSNLDIAEQVLKLVESRARAGRVPPLDLEQQRAAVARQRSTIAPLEQQERETRASIALLLGRSTIGYEVKARSLAAIEVPPVAPGIPADLLTRRPDVASAEASLAAAAANLDVARTAFLPSIGLTGSTGLASNALKSLVDPAAAAWSIGASLSQAIFDAGGRRASVKSAGAREQAALLAYRKVALTAFSEVDLALSNIEALARQRADREIEIAAAREATRIAQVRYREGADDLQALLQAQSALFSAEDSLSQLKLSQAQGAVTLFRALGGGWQRTASAS
jgi:NodT family efflux transporter outer membrane factor (OMF) lipoprotein